MSKAENQGWATIIPHTGIVDSQGYSLEVAYGTESNCAHLGQPIDPHSNYHVHELSCTRRTWGKARKIRKYRSHGRAPSART